MIHHALYAPQVKKAPCAKFSTSISPKINESPAASKKYIAARARPVKVSNMIVLKGCCS
jgi:hypothetical protein